MSKPAKAQSVTKDGEKDGFVPPCAYRDQVVPGGFTRLEISVPTNMLAIVHKELVEKGLTFPCKMRYLRMTDRQKGQLPKPESYVAVDISKQRIVQAMSSYQDLFYHDARHQLWLLGANGEQIVLDELGMLYVYPDDFLFRDILTQLGWSTAQHVAMSERDYVEVYFVPEADAQETSLMHSFGLVRWEG